MSRELATLSKELNSYFLDRRGKHYLCPDGNPRKLERFLIENDYLHLEMSGVGDGVQDFNYRCKTIEADAYWKRFQTISQQQAQGRTAIQKAVEPADLDSLQATVVPLSPIRQTMRDFDPDGNLTTLTNGLMDAFAKVKTTPTYAAQAQAQVNIANQVVNLYRVKLEVVKQLKEK